MGLGMLIIGGGVHSAPKESTVPAEVKKDWPKHALVGAGTGGGGYSVVATALCKMIEEHLGVKATPADTSGGEEVVNLIKSGNLTIGPITPEAAYDAYRGEGAFKKRGPMPIRAVFQAYMLPVATICFEGKGIKSYADLKGKRVYGYAIGSPLTRRVFAATLNAYGVKEAELKMIAGFSRSSEYIDALKAGSFDAALDASGTPKPVWSELSRAHKMRILSVDDAHMKKIQEALPFIVPTTIPGRTYPSEPNDVQVATAPVFWGCRDDLPDTFVYELVKMIYGNYDEWKAFGRQCADYRAEDVDKINTTPYHAGAIKYYREVSTWTQQLDERQKNLLAIVKASK